MSHKIPVAKPRQRTEASSACVHEVEVSTEPIGVAELQLNRDSSVVPQVRPLIQMRPTPSPYAALGKADDAVKRTSSIYFHKFK